MQLEDTQHLRPAQPPSFFVIFFTVNKADTAVRWLGRQLLSHGWYRASTNFQILEVLNFLPLKLEVQLKISRSSILRRDFIEIHRYVFCYVCAFSWTSSTEHSWVYYDCGFHGYLHCFVLIICTVIVAFLGIFIILLSVACTDVCGSPGHHHFFCFYFNYMFSGCAFLSRYLR